VSSGFATAIDSVLLGAVRPFGPGAVPSGIDKQPARREVEDMERRLAGG